MNLQINVLFLEILLLSAQGFAASDSFQSGLEDAGRQYACPGEVVNYTCTVVDTSNPPIGSSVWRGTAFNCPGSANEISLRHSLFSTSGATDTCNSGAITAESVGVVDNCYTSRLMVTVSVGLNETTVECTLSGVRVVGSSTILLTAPPAAPQTQPVTFPTPRQQFNVTWLEPPMDMNETIDAYFVNISGPSDLCGNGNMIQRVTERNYTCTIQTTPQEGERYTFTVAAANCGGDLRGPASSPMHLQVPYAPIFDTSRPDCPDLSFVDVIWQDHTENSMITLPPSDICVSYCTGDSCTDECRSINGNRPFRINNIVNRTNYTVSLSLRNDFGQSGQTTPELFENTDERCVTMPTPTLTPSPTPSTTASPAPTQLPSRTPTQPPTQSPPPATTGSPATSSETPTQPPTQTITPPTTGSPVSDDASAGAIAGGVIGGLVGAVLIVLIIVVMVFLIWRTKNSPSRKDEKDMKPNSRRVTVPGGQTIGVVCLLLAFIAVAMCVTVVTVYISRWSKKRHSSEAAPNTQELDVTYEEVDTLQSQTIRLEENVAYGPVKQDQKIELKENVAYGPVKRNQ